MKELSFVVGDRYPESGNVWAYSYGHTIFYGTPEEAEETRELLSKRANKELKIFVLTEYIKTK
jgi:hypothetical protein